MADIGNASERSPLLSDVEPAAQEQDAFQERATPLRRVPDKVPRSVWSIGVIELCERFAFFGILAPMQNYIQNAANDSLRPGGIGLGQAKATLLNQPFLCWCFVTPLLAAVIADQYIGRIKTIVLSSTIYICGLGILCLSSLHAAHEAQLSLPGLLVSLFLIGAGTGGIKTNVSSLIAEQYTGAQESTLVLKSGEKVVVDRDLTLQRIFATFYIFINMGSFSSLATTYLEKSYSFSVAFALPLAMFAVGFSIMLLTKHQYLSAEPKTSIIYNACGAIWLAASRGNGSLDAVRRHHQLSKTAQWDDVFIDELKASLKACKIFLVYPLYWAAYSQFLTNFISQAATMETHGLPNDILTNLDPISVLILLTVLDRAIFPLLRRAGLSIRLLDRITLGFIVCGISMFYTAFVQRLIYSAPPCYDHPRSLDCLSGTTPNHISIFYQAPAYVLTALSEVLAMVSGVEYAYSKAPKSMKSLVMALFLSTSSLGSLIAMAVTPLAVDPKLVYMYVLLGIGCCTGAFGIRLLGVL